MSLPSRFFTFLVFVLALVTTAAAGVPDWFRAAASQPLPPHKPDAEAVVLLDEQITTLDANGELHVTYRQVVKILRPAARETFSTVIVAFDDETRITYLKGWSITPSGQEYDIKEKEAVEVSAAYTEFYSDHRLKVLSIPGADVGSIVGHEYQQRGRPTVNEDVWAFQRFMPVKLSRYVLRLPPGWEYETFFNNHEKILPRTSGGDLIWEASDIPAIEEEDYMPPKRSIAGRMVLHFFSNRPGGTTTASWPAVGKWAGQLYVDRKIASPELKAKVAELTANSKSTYDKITALAAWVQKDIRYVAIEIGIGGYQPHLASDVFRNRFGDCKDKATLLATMLKEIGVESNPILIHATRNMIREDTPSAMTFNHVILAIRLPKDLKVDEESAVGNDPVLGRLLFFDPTDEDTPLGDLPPSLQGSIGLLVTETGGQIVHLPLLAPSVNRLMRSGALKLEVDGTLSGHVEEIRTGAIGNDTRSRLLAAEKKNRSKVIERILSSNLTSYVLTSAELQNLQEPQAPLILRYDFMARDYAKKTNSLLLVRPRVLGNKSWSIMEGNKRLYPVEFEYASFESDEFEITLPAAYEVDELPDALDVVYDFAEYHSKITQSGNKLKYSREYIVKQVFIPTSRLEDLKKFFRQVSNDERNTTVLKQKPGS